GAYVAAMPLIYGEVANYHVDAAVLVAGTLGGLYLGDRLLDGHDFTPGQGIVVELSSIAGGLVGGGLGYLVTPGDDDGTDAKIIATGAVLGAVAGFSLSYTG